MKRLLMSKEHMKDVSFLMFKFCRNSANGKESSMQCVEYFLRIGYKTSESHLSSSYCAEPIIEKVGLSGTSGLYNLGNLGHTFVVVENPLVLSYHKSLLPTLLS